MLDSETKRRIDNARDILVGKVPDPKTQVEQITFAMIYKFMDDMDQLSVGLGGNPSFFTNGYEGFAWSKLMDKRLGGEARLDLYVRALDKMSQNPYIPQLFRDVFKGAFLPYRDSETLNLFLKEMNGFTYDHSEDLGDAYEYLLSIFATQGKAGQFRTPRHIIDFIVDCVDPGKDDTVLDPACGTAGFLISAYKHILEKHQENLLTPDQKQRLTENFVGYDISPDMVRLSRVNMYLHQFPNPTIHEYDTLTTEDRWEDTFDVILANPPFMTPKGGIRPHKRFAVRANRSEVLFVDYIAEHLNVGGRAGVIVPEGIIFQSSKAYKALRKMLVEEGYLYAVVSLPAGIFQPYSGVKTSVLLMDKDLARQADSILFVKVENDGYDLGAQRNEINANDLPEALKIIGAFQADTQVDLENHEIALKVSKSKLGEDGDYNFNGEKYKITKRVSQEWPMVKLGDLIENLDRQRVPIKRSERISGPYPYYGATGVLDYVNDYLFDEKLVLLGEDGAKWGPGEVSAYAIDGKSWVNNHAHVIRPERSRLLDVYLIQVLNFMDLTPYITGVTVPKLTQKKMNEITIPLPPLDVQQAIVDEIEGYQKVIDGARQVVENYKPVIHIDPDWPLVKLGDDHFFEIVSGGTPSTKQPEYWDGDIFWATLVDLPQENIITIIRDTKRKITEKGLSKSSAKLLPKKSVIISSRATIGRIAINEIVLATNQGFKNILIKDYSKVNEVFLAFMLLNFVDLMNTLGTGGTYKEISKNSLSTISVPIPPIEKQISIVEKINKEQEMIEANKALIDCFEEKIAACIKRVWEEG